MPTKLFPRTPRLDGTDPEAKRAEILSYFHATWDRYESLFQLLANDLAYTRKPISLRHPLIFYLGHTATFFINKLVLAGLVDRRIDPRLESLFAVGVDEMSWDDLDEAADADREQDADDQQGDVLFDLLVRIGLGHGALR